MSKNKKIDGIRCPVGKAQITIAGNLSAKYVIHTVGPRYRTDSNPSLNLQSAYKNCLDLATSNKCKTIAFPALSCGAYSYPPSEASLIAINTCIEHKDADLQIIFYLFDNALFKCWTDTYKSLLTK